MLIIKLTAAQIHELAGAYTQIGEMAKAGKPGTLFAQVYGDHMRVGIMSNESMTKLYEAMGTPMEKRQAHRSAYDLHRARSQNQNAYGSHPDDDIHAGDDLMGSSS